MAGPVRGGRFRERLAPAAARLNASHAFDRRLARFDIEQSQAHVRMLAAKGLLTSAEADVLCAGLAEVAREVDEGKLTWRDDLEDVHMHVEARLREICGDVAGKLQTGRSRNDQVATDLRLYARHAASELSAAVRELQRALLVQARTTIDVVMPGYTHLQRAQPIRVAHHLLAHVEALSRDVARLGAASRSVELSPLGSGALAATSLPIDREQTAKALGFAGVTRNSLDAVSDRDFLCDLVYACTMTAVHLSGFGEELVLWSSSEFGFVRLPEAYCSGSSLMPQKINPDIAELARAKVGRTIGDLVTLLTVLKGLPRAYHKDLQETQEPAYDAVETLMALLPALTGLVAGLELVTERLGEAASDPQLCATDMAEALVRQGKTFREAHDAVGQRVRSGDFSTAPTPEAAIEARNLVGGPARAQVLREIERLERELAME